MYRKSLLKVTTVLVAGFILVSSFAGCASKNKTDEVTGTTATATSSQQQEEVKKDPVELTVMSFKADKMALTEDAPVYKAIKDKLNIKLKTIFTNWDGYNDKLNVVMASGDIPNIFHAQGVDNMPQFISWVKEGFLLPISDHTAKYPNIDKALKKFDSFKQCTDGNHYALPVISNLTATSSALNDHVLWIRKDWLDKLGLSIPQNIDEFYNVAKAFATQDPDGNGKNDTYGYTCSEGGIWWNYPVFNAFNTSTERFKKLNGQWVPELIQPETKEAIAFLKKMYSEKIMDPEFSINTGDKKKEKFIAGKVGMMVMNGNWMYNDIYDKLKKAYPDKDPKSILAYTSGIAGKDGNKRLDGFPNFWLETFISGAAPQEQIDKSLELLDFLASDEGLTLCRYGIENVHYKKEGDKFVNLVTEKNENGSQMGIVELDGTAALITFFTWGNELVPETTPNRDEYLACGAEGNKIAQLNPLMGLYIDDKALPGEVMKTATDYMNTEVIKLIISKNDLNSEWDNFVKTWLAKGGQKVWDETNKKALEEGR